MGLADRFTFSTAQAVADVIIQRTQLTLFQNNRLLFYQTEGGGVGLLQTRPRLQLTPVEVIFRVDTLFIFNKGLEFFRCQILHLGNTDTVLT